LSHEREWKVDLIIKYLWKITAFDSMTERRKDKSLVADRKSLLGLNEIHDLKALAKLSD
jgi:hypothetical protein